MPQALTNVSERPTPAQSVAQKVASNNTQIVRLVSESFDLIWNDRQRRGVIPQDVFAAFGTNAAALLGAFDLIKQAMSLVGVAAPGLPTGVTITPNPDGTVVVAEAPK